MTVPYAFSAATSAIPLSQLDDNFNTTITLGNTAIQLGNTVTTLNNMTLANVTISSGNVTITNVTVTTANATTVNTTTLIATTANVTTGNVTNLISGNVTLTGGSITGTPISGSTGSFTTLTTSGTVTLNGGVANGVAYLDGSKVLTTGSALTFDGTNLGLGTATATGLGRTFAIASGAASNRGFLFKRADTNADTAFLYSDDNNFYLGSNAGPIIFSATNAEQMRLTSTGLGIGTSSPTSIANYKSLTMNGTTGVVMDLQSNGTTLGRIQTDTTYALALWTATATPMVFGTNYTERMRLDSSGNLGLGVTPSAWGSGFVALDIDAVTSLACENDVTTVLGQGCYNNSGWKYRTTSIFGVSRYDQYNGSHIWQTAPAGTAGNAITFTQAMTLDASGNLGVGETSPGSYSKFVVRGGNGNFISYFGASTQTILGDNAGDKGQVGTVSNHPFIFITNSTERARITSGGEVLIAATALASYFDGRFNVAGRIHTKIGNAADSNHVVWNEATSGDNGFVIFGTEATYTIRGSIDYNRAGGLTRYNTTSDYRAKDIIGPVQNPGATIDALKVYEGVMKGATQSRPMLVAHEAQEHAPYAVSGVKDEVNEDGTPKFQQIDVSSLVPLLLAEIQSLRARVAQLESKGA